jgi:CelD/BcsL family acetyltransferase involved in cellulose biosynthesis
MPSRAVDLQSGPPISDQGGAGLVVSLSPAPEPARLEAEWIELEARAAGSFFTSWAWIGNWLELTHRRFPVLLLRVQLEGRVVGLALLVSRRVRRHRVLPVRQLLLHATGDPDADELTVEYNGVLSEAGLERAVAHAAFGHLIEREPGWDECVVDGVSGAEVIESLQRDGLEVRVDRRSACLGVDLTRLEQRRYVDSLNKNSRYNVRRSLRDFEVRGPVALDEARSLDEALQFLGELRRLHQAYWTSRGFPGSYASAFFREFHERLVRTVFPAGGVQLLRLRAGDVAIGYTYNLVYRGWVGQYSSGFDYEVFPGRSPGFVAHALSVDHCAARGYSAYDMMAGESRYKQQLGVKLGELTWLVLRRRSLSLQIEDALRSIRRRLGSTRPGPSPGAGEGEPA